MYKTESIDHIFLTLQEMTLYWPLISLGSCLKECNFRVKLQGGKYSYSVVDYKDWESNFISKKIISTAQFTKNIKLI